MTGTSKNSTVFNIINNNKSFIRSCINCNRIFLSVIVFSCGRAHTCALLPIRSLNPSKKTIVRQWASKSSTRWSIGYRLYGIRGVDSPIMWEHGHQFEWKSVAVHRFPYHRQHHQRRALHRHIHRKMIAINTLVVALKWVFCPRFSTAMKWNEEKSKSIVVLGDDADSVFSQNLSFHLLHLLVCKFQAAH